LTARSVPALIYVPSIITPHGPKPSAAAGIQRMQTPFFKTKENLFYFTTVSG